MTLRWTREAPTAPGWYFLLGCDGEIRVERVDDFGGSVLHIVGTPCSLPLSVVLETGVLGEYVEWAGPIPLPEEPLPEAEP